jgi:hypothetical protein
MKCESRKIVALGGCYSKVDHKCGNDEKRKKCEE